MATAGSFKPGVSGNPGGRPKTNEAFKERCRKIVDTKVVELWEEEITTRGPNALKASELLSAYAYGKPTQAVEVAGKDGGPIEVTWRAKS